MMRLRQIVEAEFTKSEYTLFSEFALKNRALAKDLGPHDVIAFISRMHNQMIFTYGFIHVKDEAGTDKTILQSVKHRIIEGTWNPFMIANYAKQVGIQLTGLRMFEDHFGYLVNGKPKPSMRGQLRNDEPLPAPIPLRAAG